MNNYREDELPLDDKDDQARITCVPISADADARQMRWPNWSQLLKATIE